MVRSVIVVFLVVINIFAIELVKPSYIYKASGGVTDIVVNSGKVYVATQASSVDIFDMKTHKLLSKIKVPQIEDFMGDMVDAKVYNVDVLNGKVILTVQATSGFRELYIYQDGKLEKLLSEDDRLYISKALFVDDTHIVFSLLGNSMYYYDYKKRKTLWTLEVKAPDAEFNSTFADLVLNEDRSLAAVADESGDIKIVDLTKKSVIKVLTGENLDKVFKVDFKNNKIITAGQDRRCVVYNLKSNNSYHIMVDFLIYAAALSPSGTLGAYSSDEQNNVIVFDTNSESKLYKLTDNLMTLNSIVFIDEDKLFIATDSPKFNYYDLKDK